MAASLQALLLALNFIATTQIRPAGTHRPRTSSHLHLRRRDTQSHAVRRRKQVATRIKRAGGGSSVIVWTNKWPAISKGRRSRTIARGGGGKPLSYVEKKVRALQLLLPNGGGPTSTELDGLFREAADYIVRLQQQVKVMQMMVSALSPNDESDD